MRHPFDGILNPQPKPGKEDTSDSRPDRRGALGRMLFAAAGLVGLGQSARAVELEGTTVIAGEEGGGVTTQAIGEEGGVTTQAIGEEGGVTTQVRGEEGGGSTRARHEEGGGSTRAIGEEGGTSARKGEEGGVKQLTAAPIEEGGGTTGANWEGGITSRAGREEGGIQPLSRDLTDEALEQAWTNLQDPTKHAQAGRDLYSARNAVAFLKGKIEAGPPAIDEDRIAQLVKDLDSSTYRTREDASEALEKMGPWIEMLLRKHLDDRPPAETKRRLEKLLERAADGPVVRQARGGLEVLTMLGTRDALDVVQAAASKQPPTWVGKLAAEVLSFRFPNPQPIEDVPQPNPQPPGLRK